MNHQGHHRTNSCIRARKESAGNPLEKMQLQDGKVSITSLVASALSQGSIVNSNSA